MSDADKTGASSDQARMRATRRGVIKGVIASGVAVSAVGYVVYERSAKRPAAGSVERLITLNINGRDRRVDVAPHETLAHTIRYKLGMTGTKISCDRAECGACTVMLDGVTTYSCSTLTQMARGRKITTIEGIAAADGGLHKVQKAMIAELGPQCGFCTSGQVVAAVALLNHNPHPTLEEARRGMSGNLCKCGAYDHYLKAVMRASQEA
jgi:aerobic-type carbon monoxide dehydrogenase small subunit (CoxS/CutS family)